APPASPSDGDDDGGDPPDAQMAYWMPGDARVRLVSPRDARATISVEAFSAPWPDDMGNPQTEGGLFGAWAMRWVGAGTFPAALQRAAAHPSAAPVRPRVAAHRAFLRIHLHYLVGIGQDDPIFPADRRVSDELAAVAEVACALLDDPTAAE